MVTKLTNTGWPTSRFWVLPVLVTLLLPRPTPSNTPVSYPLLEDRAAKLTLTVVPYEQVVAAQPVPPSSTEPASPPPTFAAATTADGLMDRRNVVSDTAQGMSPSNSTSRTCSSADSHVDIWGEADEYNDGGYLSQPATPGIMTPRDLPGHSARHRGRDGSESPVADTGMRSRQTRAAAGETIEMTSAPVNRRPGQL